MNDVPVSVSSPRHPRLWLVWLCLTLQVAITLGYGYREGWMKPRLASADSVPDTSPKIDALEEKIANQQRAIDDLSAQLSAGNASDDSEKIAALGQKISALEKAIEASNEQQSRGVQLLLALDQLKMAASSGKPFHATLRLFEKAARPYPTLKPLIDAFEPFSVTGIATLDMLQAKFSEALNHEMPATDDSLLEGMKHNLASLVRIRKVGESHTGDDDASHIARAEVAMNARNSALALREIRAIQGAGQLAFAPWLKAAEAREHAAKALHALRRATESATRPNISLSEPVS